VTGQTAAGLAAVVLGRTGEIITRMAEPGLSAEVTELGRRPAGSIPDSSPLAGTIRQFREENR
jgi:hypothetical protein